MNKLILLLLPFLLSSTDAITQQSISRLKVFIDCSTTWCDMQFIRSEVNIVDFLHDNVNSDVHVLITSQSTGSGGVEYDLIFYGHEYFNKHIDTLRFNTGPNATDFEVRDLMLAYIKAGLVPFIIKTMAVKDVSINLKTEDTARHATTDSILLKDPWNSWVIRLGANLYASADANYNDRNFSSNISANRITAEVKTGFGMNYGKNRSAFEFEENGVTEKFVVNNHSWFINHYLVKSINSNWSWSYEIKFSRNTFSNNKGRGFFMAAAEYNIFPYKEVNHKLLTLSYGLTARRNSYFDTTIYDKKEEALYGHRATAYLSLNQKWGNTYAGISYHNYFTNWKLFNLGIDIYTNVRIAGGLSFYILAFGGLTRVQVFLVKGNATPEEVLARRRQLASGYNYFTSIGLNYRFGSNLNNVVNPRFDRSSSLSSD